MQPYVDATTLREAEEELDRVADRAGELPVPLGDLYDELAEAAADSDDYELAARLEAKALATNCRHRFVAREMHGWYLLKSGAKDVIGPLVRMVEIERLLLWFPRCLRLFRRHQLLIGRDGRITVHRSELL